jgi:hypothetical protein
VPSFLQREMHVNPPAWFAIRPACSTIPFSTRMRWGRLLLQLQQILPLSRIPEVGAHSPPMRESLRGLRFLFPTVFPRIVTEESSVLRAVQEVAMIKGKYEYRFP